jgi:subtilase family serine protease
MKSHRRQNSILSLWPTEKKNRLDRRVCQWLEELETRALLSASSATAALPATAAPANEIVQPLLTVDPQSGLGSVGSSPVTTPIPGHTPQQIRQAYAIPTSIKNALPGTGETIAIVDAFNDPTIKQDVATFDNQFGLPQFGVPGGPTFKIVNQSGGTSLPSNNSSWALEIALDVEWAHAIAPGANIVLVEANSSNLNDLLAGVDTASKLGNVVSMSWGGSEFFGESNLDSHFTAPGVTYIAAAGDSSAAFGPDYPATSPYVLAVGGTTLTSTTTSGVTTFNESAWADGGGGVAAFEGEPSYQFNQPSIGSPDVAVFNPFTGTSTLYSARLTPDVAYAADPGTSTNPIGFAVFDSTPFQNHTGWIDVGGTSAGAPQWSAIVAMADQARGTHLDTNQVQATLYNTLGTSTYSKVFHDITTGSNGFSAGRGYDLATGLGTPIVSNLVPLLAATTIPAGLPSVVGSGTGGGAFSSPFGLFASTAPGGGLFSSSGSLNITTSSGDVGIHSGASGAATSPATMLSTNLASPSSAPAASAPTSANNFLASLNTTTQRSPSAPVVANTTLAAATNTVAQSDSVFGASGWNGSALSWRLSSFGLSSPAIDQLAADLSGDSLENGSDPSSEAVMHTDGGTDGVDLFMLDGAPATVLVGQVSDGGDAGSAGA